MSRAIALVLTAASFAVLVPAAAQAASPMSGTMLAQTGASGLAGVASDAGAAVASTAGAAVASTAGAAVASDAGAAVAAARMATMATSPIPTPTAPVTITVTGVRAASPVAQSVPDATAPAQAVSSAAAGTQALQAVSRAASLAETVTRAAGLAAPTRPLSLARAQAAPDQAAPAHGVLAQAAPAQFKPPTGIPTPTPSSAGNAQTMTSGLAGAIAAKALLTAKDFAGVLASNVSLMTQSATDLAQLANIDPAPVQGAGTAWLPVATMLADAPAAALLAGVPGAAAFLSGPDTAVSGAFPPMDGTSGPGMPADTTVFPWLDGLAQLLVSVDGGPRPSERPSVIASPALATAVPAPMVLAGAPIPALTALRMPLPVAAAPSAYLRSRILRPVARPGRGLAPAPEPPPTLPPALAGAGSVASGVGIGAGTSAIALMAALVFWLSKFILGRVSLELTGWRSALLTLRLERPG